MLYDKKNSKIIASNLPDYKPDSGTFIIKK